MAILWIVWPIEKHWESHVVVYFVMDHVCFVVFVLFFSVLSQEIGWEEHL